MKKKTRAEIDAALAEALKSQEKRDRGDEHSHGLGCSCDWRKQPSGLFVPPQQHEESMIDLPGQYL